MLQTVRQFGLSMIASLVAAGGALNGARIGLYTNAQAWTQGTVIGDLTEANFTGYARAAITFSSAFENVDGSVSITGGLITFQPTDAVAPNVVHGYFVVDSALPGKLLFGEPFAEPIPLADALHAVLVVPTFTVGLTGSKFGEATIIT